MDFCHQAIHTGRQVLFSWLASGIRLGYDKGFSPKARSNTVLMKNTLPSSKKRIAVAMSGGVDSSMAAYYLAQQGHELIGLTAWTLNGPGKCCNDALVNAGRVCEMLGMEYDTVDLRAEFSHYVMDYYNHSYEQGLTPNPCVECNRYVKWELLVDYAVRELGVDYVATGHYARLDHSGPYTKVFRAVDEHKDQTYMMTRVYQKDLAKTLFPLGEMVKPEVVAKAKEIGIPTAYSKESQDVCFVLNGQANYLKGVFGPKPGPIVDMDTGKIVGEHEGHFHFTLGQRRGIKVAVGRPVYVVKIDPDTNTVYIGDPHHIQTTEFTVLSTSWVDPALEQASVFPVEAMIKIRYNTPPTLGIISLHPENPVALKVCLYQPQTAVTPGQIAAFYDPTYTQLWGGGYIQNFVHHPAFDPDRKKELPNLFCKL